MMPSVYSSDESDSDSSGSSSDESSSSSDSNSNSDDNSVVKKSNKNKIKANPQTEPIKAANMNDLDKQIAQLKSNCDFQYKISICDVASIAKRQNIENVSPYMVSKLFGKNDFNYCGHIHIMVHGKPKKSNDDAKCNVKQISYTSGNNALEMNIKYVILYGGVLKMFVPISRDFITIFNIDDFTTLTSEQKAADIPCIVNGIPICPIEIWTKNIARFRTEFKKRVTYIKKQDKDHHHHHHHSKNDKKRKHHETTNKGIILFGIIYIFFSNSMKFF